MAKKKPPAAASLFDEPPADTPAVPPPADFPASWGPALGGEFGQPYFAKLQEFVAAERTEHEVFPAADDVYNAFKYTPFDGVKVVLLGQDPYPTPGHAHGLCFSVRPGVALPASLRNIYKELESDLGIPPAKHGYLAAWAKQGVLMLNAVLTVRSGTPNSHANRGWEKFTDAALKAVNAKTEPVVFVLWGGYAGKKKVLIDANRHEIIQSAHPSPLSAHNGFFGSKPFSKINAALTDFGHAPIDWKLPEKVS
ncbi:uracil-DNA glycosylase [Limnoglobus roseus]|uniref:Uracil-DNA glycosylase n=1 Tax=Limnoglobus roseus TaxID=2598579 RepID=A0A5C1ABT9_9BACT|nr:uracil-DNA glycosylase [Limnoglobus roseus]QEL15262.1 uracil-DNA glycosylase [Limnoglobus roseus]